MKTYPAPVGLVSRKRAEYLMRAAAVSGGAVYVGLNLSAYCLDSLHNPYGSLMYLAVGTLPSGEPVPTKLLDPDTVLAALRGEVERLSGLAADHSCLVELRDEVRGVLADLEDKLAS